MTEIKEIYITEINNEKCLIIPIKDIKQHANKCYDRDNSTNFEVNIGKNKECVDGEVKEFIRYALATVWLSSSLEL